MPAFDYQGKTHNNPVEPALDQIGGKWEMSILRRLKDGGEGRAVNGER